MAERRDMVWPSLGAARKAGTLDVGKPDSAEKLNSKVEDSK